MFLQVGQLGEALSTCVTFEGSLSTVHTQMHLRTQEGKESNYLQIKVRLLQVLECQYVIVPTEQE